MISQCCQFHNNYGQTFDGTNHFDVEVLLFQKNMWVKVVEVKKSFLHFLTNYDPHQVHNMLAITLDLHFKSL
jgi:hypothetical protein